LFLFICGIPFIRVICGSLVTFLYGKGLPFRIPSLPHGFRGFPWLLPQNKPQKARLYTDLENLVRHRLPLMFFLFISGIPFIRVICGSLVTSLYGKGLPFRIPSLPQGFRGFPWLLPQDKPRIARMYTDYR
jgi:hypothetical protein